jgi:CRISPR-associated protein Csm2
MAYPPHRNNQGQQRPGNANRNPAGQTPGPSIASRFNPDWIRQRITSDCITFAEEAGRELVDQRFTTSQIRNVFGEIRRIQLKGFKENKTSFLLLKPKLAYAAKRAGSKGAETFREIVTRAHDAVKVDEEGDEKRFANFCDLVEAILAYHKASGGRD